MLHFASPLLSEAELLAAQSDGHTARVGEGFIPADAVETPALRARSLTPLIPPGTAGMGPTAVWIYGFCATAPVRHHVVRVTPKRIRPPASPLVRLHETEVASAELTMIGPLAVTTPFRTLVDLLHLGNANPDFAPAARLLVQALPELHAQVEPVLASWGRTPGKKFALQLHAELARVVTSS